MKRVLMRIDSKVVSKKILAAVLLFFPLLAMGGDVQKICHRASSDLQCSYLKIQWNLNLMFLAKYGLSVYEKDLSVRIGVMSPKTEVMGDVLYLHGFSDRLDNHIPLFTEFNRQGFRVISFDLPGHGENYGKTNDISSWSFTDLSKLAAAVESHVVQTTRVKPKRLFLAGWSTGGLIALRMMQGLQIDELSRFPSGLILYAPGLAVREPWNLGDKSTNFAWGLIGRVTQESLTHHLNPPHNGPIKPISPVVHMNFGLNLMYNSLRARSIGLFMTQPTLVFSAGESEDLYADTVELKRWVNDQKARGKMVSLVECDGARHELDNEKEPMGETVRKISGDFLSLSLAKDYYGYFDFHPGGCRF